MYGIISTLIYVLLCIVGHDHVIISTLIYVYIVGHDHVGIISTLIYVLLCIKMKK